MKIRPMIRVVAGIISLLALAAGCGHTSAAFRDNNMDFSSIQTVAVMPFANLSHDTLATDRVRDVFSSMLLASGQIYVLPPGEVARGIARANLLNPAAPSAEEVVKFGGIVGAQAVITGVVKEYGEVRSANSSANVISMSVEVLETQTGKAVFKASSTKGGVTFVDRMVGGGGKPMNDITEAAVDDLLNQLFK